MKAMKRMRGQNTQVAIEEKFSRNFKVFLTCVQYIMPLGQFQTLDPSMKRQIKKISTGANNTNITKKLVMFGVLHLHCIR